MDFCHTTLSILKRSTEERKKQEGIGGNLEAIPAATANLKHCFSHRPQSFPTAFSGWDALISSKPWLQSA
jgi:hypothetical protein